MSHKKTFWSKIPTDEKPGLITFVVIFSAIQIFAFGVTVGKYML